MNHLYPSEPAGTRREEDTASDREISLGAATILGIFFALALVCAGFFGLGYSMGRKTAQAAAVPPPAAAPLTVSTVAKPAAGSLIAPTRPAAGPAQIQPQDTPATPPPTAISQGLTPADSRIVGDAIPARSAATLAVPAVASGGTFMVQIAAVSSQEIADIELAALRKYGYDVVIRHEPQDALLHVQIGPYATRKDAEAMRQNVLAHGFNAIVK